MNKSCRVIAMAMLALVVGESIGSDRFATINDLFIGGA